MRGVLGYFWRLVPANPILLRVVGIGGKRKKDLAVRCAYLGLLIAVVLVTLLSADVGGGDLDKLTATSTDLFVGMSYLQLALVALLAPIFTAGAITQEKDSQTYDILLATPLTNGQVVLGTLLSRLFFVFALLVSGIPIFGITQIFGGVSIGDIVRSAAIAGVTALLVGSVAVAIATFKIGTRRTIFSFYLLIVIYLVGGYLLDAGVQGLKPTVIDPVAGTYTADAQTSWLTGLHPFLALRSVLDPVTYAPPSVSDLEPSLRSWPVRWYLTNPAGFFLVAGTVVSLVLVVPSVLLLRRMAQSTLTFNGWLAQKFAFLPGIRPPGDRPARSVWNNPIAWREAKTKASAARAGILRYAFILIGLGLAISCAWLYSTEDGSPRSFVTRGAIGGTGSTITLNGENGGTYALSPTAKITLNGNEVGPYALDRRLVVQGTPSFPIVNGVPTVTALTLVDVPTRLSADTARDALLGLVFLEVAAILLIVTNAAASTVTREREDGTLDLLLSTPITSRYYIWGKLRGLVSFALPLIVVPAASCLAFVLVDVAAGGREWLVFPEAVLIVPALLVVTTALAAMCGMRVSLSTQTTVKAVMISLAIVLAAFAGAGWCGTALADNGGSFGVALASFSPITVMMMLIDPSQWGGDAFSGNDAGAARMIVLVFSIAACAAYAAIVWGLYKSMVTNFDMTIRKQQR